MEPLFLGIVASIKFQNLSLIKNGDSHQEAGLHHAFLYPPPTKKRISRTKSNIAKAGIEPMNNEVIEPAVILAKRGGNISG